MAGFTTLVSVAVLLAGPVVRPVALTPEVVFANDPALLTVTLTVMVQVPLAAIVPARSEMPVSPTAVFAVSPELRRLPPQPFEVPSGDATVIPAGNESVKTTPVRAVVVLWRTKVSVAVSPAPMAAGTNDFVMPMRPTVSVAVFAAGPAAAPVSAAVTPEAVSE